MPEHTIKTSFFEYIQNNSGGSWFLSEGKGIGHVVWIEAVDAKFADGIAEDLGLYFDGCDTGRDCDCCGDRWRRASIGWVEVMGSLEEITKQPRAHTHNTAYVHFLDRTFQKII